VELCGAVDQSGSNATDQVASGDRQVSNNSGPNQRDSLLPSSATTGNSLAGRFTCHDALHAAVSEGVLPANLRHCGPIQLTNPVSFLPALNAAPRNSHWRTGSAR
jgi:hypothetical protein